MADHEARKKALEERKKKLEDMKKKRELGTAGRENDSPATSDNVSGGTAPAPPAAVTPAGAELDAWVAGLLGEGEGAAPAPAPSHTQATSAPAGPPRLSLAQLSLVTGIGSMACASKAAEMYDKCVGTDEDLGGTPAPSHHRARSSRISADFSAIARRKGELFPETPFVEGAEEEEGEGEEGIPFQASLPADESVLATDAFADFVSRSAVLIDRALVLSDSKWLYDVTVDYAVPSAAWNPDAPRPEGVTTLCVMSDAAKFTKGRTVTGVAWSPRNKEVCVCCYGPPATDDVTAPLGLVALWSVLTPQRPERVFTCPSGVECVWFHPHHPHLLLASSYAGQLFCWDLRQKATPVQRSKLSLSAHTFPVHCGAVAATASGCTLVTLSTDGRVCVWDGSNLTEPLSCAQLQHESRDISPLCVSVPNPADVTIFTAGCEDGGLYVCAISGRSVAPTAAIRAHNGPVTSVHHNPFAPCVLSAGMDWAVKLWPTHKHARTGPRAETGGHTDTAPLLTLESNASAVFDVQWCPTHVSVFASGDGTGTVEIWNLLTDADNSVYKYKVGDAAVNRLRWGADGRHIAVGDSNGVVTILKIAAEVVTQRAEDVEEFRLKLAGWEAAHSAALRAIE